MYKKGSKGWLKHFDFILLDMICLQIAFLLAYVIRHDSGSPYIVPLYRNMAIFMELLDIVVMFFYETLSNVLKRGYFREFAATVKHVLLVELFSVLYLFTMQEGQAYSRTALYLTGVIYAILTYIVRIIWKKILRSRMSEGNRSLLVVTTKDMAEQVVHNIRENNYERFALSGLVIIDDDLCGTKIAGVPVVANEENAAAYVCREWIDEVFVIPATDVPYPYALMEQFTEAGVTVHLNLAKVSEAMGGKKQLVEKVGPYTVLTTSINYASTKQLFMKRAIDIAGGLFGCLLTLLITLFVGPAIYLKSPGPIFFSQERVGKNGKKFKMYKFRSMYMDAEERKAELMKQNRVSDGMMFKLDFDPRVIGNEILPDGTKKTGIGNFIRVTSLDEFPQFFNVLKGDMSIVGTRPPTLDEWNKYELHHRARLAIKPGITGMWQVSGRSEITDFEEVVKLDTEYIGCISVLCIIIGALTGTWVSFGARKFEIEFEDLASLEKDKMTPVIRLIYIAVASLIFALLMSVGLIDVKIGNVDISKAFTDIKPALVIGVLCGLVESKIGIQVYNKAVSLLVDNSEQ